MRKQADLLRTIVHQLKTPLTINLLCLEKIFNDYKLQKNLKEDLLVLKDNYYYLNNILQKFLMAEKLEQGGIVLMKRPIKIGDLANEVFKLYAEVAKSKNKCLTINIKSDKTVFVDKLLFKQMAGNIIDNAFKFASKVHLEFGFDKRFFCSVSDNGPGLKEQTKIFEKFFSISQSLNGGLGIGLYIAKQIAINHRGEIEVSNSKMGGAKFTIVI
jgi:signal transduction histidine kinase